jgi:rsbT co-antagonist protein RsbR
MKELADVSAGAGKADELERMRALLGVLYEGNPDGVAYSDAKGTLIFNPAASRLLNMNLSGPDTDGVETWATKYGCFMADGVTLCPTEALPLARGLRGETVRDCELIIKNPQAPDGVWISASAAPLPGGAAIVVFRDITARKHLERDLEQRNEELARQMRDNNSLIERLRLAVDELSTPVLELWDDILALPVVGVVDTVRSARMMEKVLAEAVIRRCRSVIIDVTGVDVIDTGTADRFLRIARSIELLGAECVISGVQPSVAQTLTDLGVGFRGLVTQRNLKRALDYCISRQPQVHRRGAAV